ncbi:ATP-binding cassette sub-family G member 4-like isoform X2 [Aricia agestis]|uniref:ATP-binding cassette sub-family G member 4-like isoform X2 n=1 Tax=Aricia agestis TaxID=91739 RepID=UPI001C20B074|nr:ATP-binding cassette sub-family G member 4-like isoform X2 [Aricia agestis]
MASVSYVDYASTSTESAKMLSPISVDVSFDNITVTRSTGIFCKGQKRILKNVSGLFKSGQMTAIMGPSGAGKSSLLNALTGFSQEGVKGTIRAGDRVLKMGEKDEQLFKEYRRMSCYILQDDRLNPMFTVNELMNFAVDLKLGSSLTEEFKQSVIIKALDTLGLSGAIETKCCRLSGGQKKRLSIAVELISNPPVIFLDEPTTGLDSLSTLQCIKMLKRLALKGHTVVCTLHQPSARIYKMFDQVYILAEGMCIYNGPSEETVPYLAKFGFKCPVYHNPADYVMEVANGEYGKFNEFLSANCPKRIEKAFPMDQVHAVKRSFSKENLLMDLHHLRILLKRGLVNHLRDWTVTQLKILLHFLVGVTLGLVFQQAGDDSSKTFNNLGFFLISVVYVCYTSLMPAALRFSDEIPVLKKENFNNWYKLKTYYSASIILGIPLQIIFSIAYTLPSYLITGQPIEMYRFVMFVLVLTALGILSDALGNLIGTLVNPINGTFFGAISVAVMLLLAGFLVLITDMLYVMQVLSYASYLRFGYEALVLSVYSHGRPSIPCPETKDYCHLKSPKEILKLLSFDANNYWRDVGVLIAEIFVIRVIAYYALKYKIGKSK